MAGARVLHGEVGSLSELAGCEYCESVMQRRKPLQAILKYRGRFSVNLIYTQYTPQLAWKFDYLVGMRREMRVYIHGEPNLKTALNKFYST
jgi:hypothetical protein